MSSIILKGIEVYHPEKKVSNDFYIEHFKKQGKNVERLLEAYGRKERYVAGENENTLTMAIEAGRKVLKSCNLTGKDIDLFIFSTNTPEYIWPANSMAIYDDLGINESAQFFDLCLGCLGMTTAADTACSILKAKPNFKRALLIGSEDFSDTVNRNDEYLYGIFGDAACAAILEKTEEENVGFLDSEFINRGDEALKYVRYPLNGFKAYFKDPSKPLTNIWESFSPDYCTEAAYIVSKKLNERNGLSLDDIDHFCFSQFAIGMQRNIIERMGADESKFIYIGDKYGYTASNSPFMALHDGIKSGRIKKGDLISMWTVGLLYSTAGLLLRY